MRHISVCSGAGGMDLGFHNAGSQAVALCEFDPWRRELLAHHWPGVPIFPDLSTLDPEDLPDADLLIGGTPCPAFSVAGLRAGLEDPRSGLYWDYQRIRLANNIEWAVWENVEGALSSNDGLDFAQVLGAFVGSDVHVPTGGWPRSGVAAGPWGGCVWRVLDAQHFGVPQRRRRVFVVGRLGGPCPPEVLLEFAGGYRDLAARESTRQDSPGAPVSGTLGAGRRSQDDDNYVAPALVKRYAKGTDSDATDALIVNALDRQSGGPDDNSAQGNQLVAHTLTSAGFDASEDGTGRGTPLVSGTVRSHMRPGSNSADVVCASPDSDGVRTADGLAGRLDGAASRWDPQPDGRRYAACGDGVVAHVAEWIGRRLLAVTEVGRPGAPAEEVAA